jgi:hypothetical protein
MGAHDCILNNEKGICKLCGRKFVCYQDILCDDSHYGYEQQYNCPCNLDIKEKRKLAKRRADCFIDSEIPATNMLLVLEDLAESDGVIPPEFDFEKPGDPNKVLIEFRKKYGL